LRAAPLDEFDLRKAVERLALSLQQRREAEAKVRHSPAAASAAVPQGFSSPPSGELPRFGFEPTTPIEIELPSAPLAAKEAAEPAPNPVPATAPAPALPAAMRPLDLGSEADDDHEIGDALLPRFPFAGSKPPPASDMAQSTLAEPAASNDTDPDTDDEDAAADESFSSLLDLGRIPMRQPLVRIEEPSDESDEIEPVVIFPGQGSRPFAAPAPSAPEPAPAPPPPGPRPFDAPEIASGEAETPVPASGAGVAAAPRQDREETERALRAALATLQRMSGAA
jgi:hypothetical protein